jgi:hypothetical protein|tara:strand:+ start:1869 stop:2015 length:147 start_codon:yes stop_codon:yes gene_type:complete
MILKILLMKFKEGFKQNRNTSGFVLDTSASSKTNAYTTLKNLEFKAVF